MRIEVTRDVEAFAQPAAPFLAARLERNLLATVLASVRDWAAALIPVDAVFALATDGSAAEPVGVALRTPPWQMLATGFDDAQTAEALIAAWLDEDPELPGVSGEPATARALVRAWMQLTGGVATLEMRELLHELTEVIPPERPARGRLRQATLADRPELIEWERGFSVEAGSGDPELAAARVDRRMDGGFHYVWDDGGPVSMLAHTHFVSGASRIGPVYTPPDRRGRGYATSAVAELTQLLLDRGATRCLIYTDVTNPTSNRIYASIGYRPFAEWEVYDFIDRS